MAKYKVLLVGCGNAGMSTAEAGVIDGRAEIVGLFDPVAKQLGKAKEKYPEAKAGDDYARLLEQTKPNMVIVAGPDHLHAEQTLLAMEHDCHVLVEKPMTTTVADAQKVVDMSEKTGLEVMTDHTMRYTYPWKEMALMARSGQVGKVFFLQGDYVHDMRNYYSPRGLSYTPWRADKKHPQNILLGGGCHSIDLMHWIIDVPVDEVHCYSNKMSAPEFSDDDCYILSLRFVNGVLGKVFVSSGCSGPVIGVGHLEVYGTAGTLTTLRRRGACWWLSEGKLMRHGQKPRGIKDTSKKRDTLGGHAWGRSVRDFLDTLDGKIENPIPARVGAKTVAVCDAALKSIKMGRPQKPVEF